MGKALAVGGLVLVTIFLLSAAISVASPYLSAIILVWSGYKIWKFTAR